MRRGAPWLVALGVAGSLLVTACGGAASDDAASSPEAGGDPAAVSGEITVLTNRTDLVQDGTFDEYAAAFNEVYPDVSVEFEAITDYEGEVKIRMNTDEYGDVLLIPNSISQADYPTYFSSLGTAEDLGETYRYVANATVDDEVYGLAQNGNAAGFTYNKALWELAGITEPPTTPDEFIADLQAVKDETGAIPLYTNYKDGWPLTKWTDALGTASCDPDAKNALAETDSPWAEGSDLQVSDTILYTAVENGLTEPDPTTTNWEDSKTLLANGEVSAMWLGSWAISQMQAAAEEAGQDPADIGFLPFPTQTDGTFCTWTGPDYLQAVNKNSANQEAAKAWVTWFTEDSGYAESQGSISTVKAAPLPDTLADFEAAGVEYVELTPPSPDMVGVVDDIDNEAEIGIYSPDYRQNLVDVARGAAEGDLQSILDDLNARWAAARASVEG